MVFYEILKLLIISKIFKIKFGMMSKCHVDTLVSFSFSCLLLVYSYLTHPSTLKLQWKCGSHKKKFQSVRELKKKVGEHRIRQTVEGIRTMSLYTEEIRWIRCGNPSGDDAGRLITHQIQGFLDWPNIPIHITFLLLHCWDLHVSSVDFWGSEMKEGWIVDYCGNVSRTGTTSAFSYTWPTYRRNIA